MPLAPICGRGLGAADESCGHRPLLGTGDRESGLWGPAGGQGHGRRKAAGGHSQRRSFEPARSVDR